jgi:hypothetical protein
MNKYYLENRIIYFKKKILDNNKTIDTKRKDNERIKIQIENLKKQLRNKV